MQNMPQWAKEGFNTNTLYWAPMRKEWEFDDLTPLKWDSLQSKKKLQLLKLNRHDFPYSI